MNTKRIINIISIIGLAATIFYMFWLWKEGILTDEVKMNEYISGLGAGGVIVFIIIQIIQVIIPIIPGGISCVVGISLFGIVKGLIYNYIGICIGSVIGSVIVFFIARRWGRPLVEKMFSEKKIQKYEAWLNKGNKMTIAFALLIVSPVAPDDFLCYLVGTMNMKFKHYLPIILLGKPLPIAIYSLGLHAILRFFLNYVG